ncbi:MAG: hypothetical protein EOO20_15390 [Chryseobacterium sp.]|nr:MAG: hypothetical protein EOO20_15390 [Chryseobacterium sp.]
MSKLYSINDEIASVLAALVANAPKVEPLKRGDWNALRNRTNSSDYYLKPKSALNASYEYSPFL